jgi:hypothetical protein
MNTPYLSYKSCEPALLKAFETSKLRPEVDVITFSDMIATGGEMHSSRLKLSFTTKTGNFIRYYMYIPGSLLAEQHYLSDEEKSAVDLWLKSIDLIQTPLK